MVTPKVIAEWMLEELNREKYLYQEVIVYDLVKKFGEQFTYTNENGNLAIDKGVLREFRNLTESTVVWVRADRAWRFREDFDNPDKREAD